MKKLIPILLTLFAICSYAQAEELFCDTIIATEPRMMQQSPGIALFSARPSVEQQLYDVIEEGLCAHAASINVSAFDIPLSGYETDETQITISGLLDIYCSVVYNHPEYGDLRTGFIPSFIEGTTSCFSVIPLYLENYSQAEYDRIVDYTMSRVIAPGMTDMDKLLAIHDFLADKITYSAPTKPVYNKDGTPQLDSDGNQVYDFADSVFTPYGALVNYDAVCQGYSLAFKLLCDRAGLTCGYAVSTIESHMWNVVEYNENIYHVDVTWDDPKLSNGMPIVQHKFFLISDEENMNNRSSKGYDGYYWTSSFGSCDDSELHSTLYVADKIDPFHWRGGCFWYECTGKLVNGSIGLYNYSKLFRMSGDTAEEVSQDEYLPLKRLAAELFPAFDGKTAIDGPADSSADLYAANYNDDCSLVSVKRIYLTFDSLGRAVVTADGYSKLMLFSVNEIAPLAYPFYN